MPKKKKSLLSEIIPEHDEQEFMDEYYNDPKTSKKSRSVALGILSLFPATNLFKALNLLKNFKTAKNLSVKDTFNPKKWDSKLKSKLEKLSDVSAGQTVGILASGGKDMVIERAEKNKGGILNNDKDRIGYLGGGEHPNIDDPIQEDIERITSETNLKNDMRSYLTIMNVIDNREDYSDEELEHYEKQRSLLDVKFKDEYGLNSEDIQEWKHIVSAEIDAEREQIYGGGLLSDDKDRMTYAEGEEVDQNDMQGVAISVAPVTVPEEEIEQLEQQEGEMIPDEQMEDEHLDFIISQALSPEEETSLMTKLEADPELSIMFDKVLDTAMEFSGSGPVNGLGSKVSDSIPARLSDGEFVMTADATEEIGSDNLQSMMEEAEEAGRNRRQIALGGEIEDEPAVDQYGKPVDEDITAEEIKKSMLSINPRLQ